MPANHVKIFLPNLHYSMQNTLILYTREMFYQILKLGDWDGNLKSVADIQILCEGRYMCKNNFHKHENIAVLSTKIM